MTKILEIINTKTFKFIEFKNEKTCILHVEEAFYLIKTLLTSFATVIDIRLCFLTNQKSKK